MDLHSEHHSIENHGGRRVRVFLPAQYDPKKAFPLLVMFDGQNVFDDHGSYAGGWRAHVAVDRLGKKRSRPIVVGVDHGGVARIGELAPFRRGGGGGSLAPVTAGGTDSFLAWVARGLVPDLRARYRVIDGPAGVLVAGSSLGGLAATYAHFKWPEVFGGVLAMSPSFWLGQPKIFDFVAAQSKPWTSQVYLDAGEREGPGLPRLVERMARLLRDRGYDERSLLCKVDPKGTHSERAWRRRLPAALRFFYR